MGIHLKLHINSSIFLNLVIAAEAKLGNENIVSKWKLMNELLTNQRDVSLLAQIDTLWFLSLLE